MLEKNPLPVIVRPFDLQELRVLSKMSKESPITLTSLLAESIDEINISVKVGEIVTVIAIDFGAGIALAANEDITGTLYKEKGSWKFLVDGPFEH